MNQNLIEQISIFEKNYDHTKLSEAKKLHDDFLARFPREQLTDLTLEGYALGRTETGSLCWWLEYHTPLLGSIKGGSASKHIIYYSRKDGDWKFPSNWASVQEAWQKLRSDIVELISLYDHEPFGELEAGNLLFRANMLKGKLLFLYRPDKFLPIYQVDHLQTFLTALEVPKEFWSNKDNLFCNLLLCHTIRAIPAIQEWHPVKVKDFLYETFLPEEKYYKIAPGQGADLWEECLRGGFISMGWDEIGDLTQFPDYDEYMNAFQSKGFHATPSKNTEKANELWQFYNLKTGDKVVANKGKSQVLAIGTVTGAYEYKPELEAQKHTVPVNWETIFNPPLDIPPQDYWPMKTLLELTKKQVQDWTSPKNVKPAKDKASAADTLYFSAEDELFFTKLEQSLERKGQTILYGPPGTGKTYMARRYIQWKSQKESAQGTEPHVEMVTFHPSFNYEDFIEGYKPVSGDQGTVSFQLEKGIFSTLCKKAQDDPNRSFYLIIDELNRGNVPKIFGEIITLLEKDKRGMELRLPQSKDVFAIPANLYIMATMNTSDRSIKMMDAALKRRFLFIECMPRYDLLQSEVDSLGMSTGAVLRSLNEALIRCQGRDKQIGHAYFMKNGQALTALADLKEVYELEIIPLVQEYCFDDYELLAEIVGKGFVDAPRMEFRTDLFQGPDDAFGAEMINRFKG